MSNNSDHYKLNKVFKIIKCYNFNIYQSFNLKDETEMETLITGNDLDNFLVQLCNKTP